MQIPNRMSKSSQPRSFSVIHSASDFRSMLRLAVPALAEEFLVLAVTWTDWWLTGHFFHVDGDATKTAMSMMGYLMWLIPSMFSAVSIGATALVARYVGSGDPNMANRAANQAFIVGVGVAVIMLTLAIQFGDSFLTWMQLRGKSAEFADQYFEIVIWSIPMIMISIVGAACLRGAGDMVTGFLVKMVVVIANILISFSLVTGWGPLPEVGWPGLAIGTAVGHALGGAILFCVILRGRAGLKLSLAMLRPAPIVIGNILRVGLPGGFDIAVLLSAQMVFLSMINAMGESAAAAHGLAVQMEAACYLPGAAFQAAAATMAGQFLGAGMLDRAKRSGWWCLAGGGIVMCLMGGLLFLHGREFGYFFTGDFNDPSIIKAAELLKIIAVVMPLLAVVMILTGSLRGAGDTVWPFVFTILGFFVIRIPLAIYFGFGEMHWFQEWGIPIFGMELGVTGAWYAMIIDIAVRAFLVLGRYLHGGWTAIKI